MTSWAKFGLAAALVAVVSTGAVAQETTNKVDEQTHWNVFAEPPQTPNECFGVAIPKETVNTDENGRIKAVRRGDIMLFVTFNRGKSGGVVSFTGGYPFAPNSFVSMEIGDNKFELFTDGEWAWPATPADDSKIIAAMKRGAEATLTARSSRGTITKDTFSLLGFTAASESAANYCGA
ncbi:MAG: invasion associated locus B family protein [Pseudomonadota bacterium]|jgi:hypothetical protein|nr:invasion associated locus B family protein [Pseudomonadota bacterium]